MVTSTNRDRYAELSALLRAGLKGNAASYHHFLQAITPILRRVTAAKIMAADVEDVLQEILISIHKARHTYDGERPVMPWLLAIAQFRINDYLRRHYAGARREIVAFDEVVDSLVQVTNSLDDNESIDELLVNVADREKQILTLMHVEDYTAKETGQKLGMKESAVKVAAHRALKKLRERWKS